MIKVSRLADYAVVILAGMSKNRAELMTGAQLSRDSGLPEPTVAKVLKLLAKSDVLTSVRGANGGYRLNGKPEDINISDVIMAVDGPIALASCVEGSTADCDYTCNCPVKGRWDRVNDAIRGALEDVTLADMLDEDKLFSGAREGMQKHGYI